MTSRLNMSLCLYPNECYLTGPQHSNPQFSRCDQSQTVKHHASGCQPGQDHC